MAQDKSIWELLSEIQDELTVPKNNYNSFGKYAYRSAEDILAAVKPLLFKRKLTLTIDDEITCIGDNWHYVKATAKITGWDVDKVGSITATAYAREQKEVKGQIEAQTTGSTSSYARKYALCGLFAIDGEADPDATNTHGKGLKTHKPNPRNEALTEFTAVLGKYCEKHNADFEQLKAGIKKRPDFDDSADFYRKLTEEFKKQL